MLPDDLDIILPNRAIVSAGGEDRVSFLQGLVTNDVGKLSTGRAVYACLLSAQGKFLHDFFIVDAGDRLMIDCEADRRDDLVKRLRMYRLRSRVDIQDEGLDWVVAASAKPLDEAFLCYADPRNSGLGFRSVRAARDPALHDIQPAGFAEYERLRMSLCIPDGSRDMIVDKSILLENNIDVLNGIAWDKGCYMGQELTARTKYRGLIRKRLKTVRIEGEPVPAGTILSKDGTELGEMRTSCGDIGLAMLRIEALPVSVHWDNTIISSL